MVFFCTRLCDEARHIITNDPATTHLLQVLLLPGFWALRVHSLAHFLWTHHLRLPALLLMFLIRILFSIEIHPGATIGKYVVVDHGTGVVIGETAVVGDNVLIFQGVTLGGTGHNVGHKRHPTIGPNCIIGCNACVLGNITVAHDCRIGANSVVTRNATNPYCTLVGAPARCVKRRTIEGEQLPCAMAGEEVPDSHRLDHNALPDFIGEARRALVQLQRAVEKHHKGTAEFKSAVRRVQSLAALSEAGGEQFTPQMGHSRPATPLIDVAQSSTSDDIADLAERLDAWRCMDSPDDISVAFTPSEI
jgi:serine O-acetyltransferase|eukprot:gnl/Ergobibamus_cyprinoides/2068.p1 GENE.gnl/Ergobibamus_cyprinoides/2068~~gnl/Ergobibamus_cyprinoides/2068.p1  ORF type:complete len:330 (+),score=80.20 gnl/Ergobibamus_cyprinoides/2068:77-991(+)